MTGPDQWDGSLVREDKWTTSPRRVVPDGCVFITVKGAGVGTIFPGVAAAIGRDIYAFEPRRELNWRFVETAIRHTVQQLTRTAVGDIPGLSKGPILEHQVTFPPLPEQLRVVEALDSYFSRLDEAEAALDRVQRNLKRYRAAVLQAAVEGRLVPTEAELARAEGRDYEPASELLKRILAERRRRWEQARQPRPGATGRNSGGRIGRSDYPLLQSSKADTPHIPEGWTYTTLPTLLPASRTGMKTGPFGSLLKKQEHRDEGVPVIGIENIESMRFVSGSRIRISRTKAEDLSAYDVRPGDLLISRSGTVGEVCVAPSDIGEARFSTNIMRVRLLSGSPLPEFLALLLNGSQMIRQQISDRCAGTTRDFLNQEILSSIVFPIPPLAEQRRILTEIERLISRAESATTEVTDNLRRLRRLRQAILKWAFEGKLVDQDSNDEPASVLLERIRTERAAQTQKPGGRTRSQTPNGDRRPGEQDAAHASRVARRKKSFRLKRNA